MVSAQRDKGRMPSARAVAIVAILALCLLSAASLAAPVTIPVTASDGTPMGVITVDVSPNGKGVVGGFQSTCGKPPSLQAAAAANGEDHFNWYQVVVRDNHPPTDAAGNPLTPPYVDPPNGGYPGQWADNKPWYWDEGPFPPPETPGYDPIYNLGSQLVDTDGQAGADKLNYADFPWGEPGTSLEFNTWLVSLNADGSIHSYHGGFSWTWDRPAGQGGGGGGGRELFEPLYGDQIVVITGVLAPVPEPGTALLVAFGGFGLLMRVRRRAARKAA